MTPAPCGTRIQPSGHGPVCSSPTSPSCQQPRLLPGTQVVRGTVDPIFIYLGVTVVPVVALRHAVTFLESERRNVFLDRELTYDTLTGLWNRRTLSRKLDHLLLATDHDLAVLAIDIDDFKSVNDSVGPTAGDALLRQVADRLRAVVAPPDLLARLGGDEFVVVMQHGAHLGDVIDTVTRLRGAFADPFTVGSALLRLPVSVGIAVPEGATDAGDLLRNADMAMYTAKRRGRNGYALYEPALRVDAVERISLMADLEHALTREEFVLHYQPVFRLDGSSPIGAEALIRWRHPTRGLLRPDEFIPIVEAGPHVDAVGTWVLREATQFASRVDRRRHGRRRLPRRCERHRTPALQRHLHRHPGPRPGGGVATGRGPRSRAHGIIAHRHRPRVSDLRPRSGHAASGSQWTTSAPATRRCRTSTDYLLTSSRSTDRSWQTSTRVSSSEP